MFNIIRVTYDLLIRYAECPFHLSVMSGFRMVFPPIHVLITVESDLVIPVGDGSFPVSWWKTETLMYKLFLRDLLRSDLV